MLSGVPELDVAAAHGKRDDEATQEDGDDRGTGEVELAALDGQKCDLFLLYLDAHENEDRSQGEEGEEDEATTRASRSCR